MLLVRALARNRLPITLADVCNKVTCCSWQLVFFMSSSKRSKAMKYQNDPINVEVVLSRLEIVQISRISHTTLKAQLSYAMLFEWFGVLFHIKKSIFKKLY